VAREHISTGVDIGTTTLQVATFIFPANSKPRALALVKAPVGGMRKGFVVDADSAASSLAAALKEASLTSGARLDSVVMGVSGPGVRANLVEGAVASGRADGEIASEDVERSLKMASASIKNPNRELFHIIPRYFNVDQEVGVWDPVGMKGLNLKAFAVAVEGSKSYMNSLEAISKLVRVKVSDIVFNPLAASEIVLSPHDKEIGTLLVDIGGATTTYALFEDGSLGGGGTLSFGSRHVTTDIGLGFRIDLALAEKLKCEYGTTRSKDIARKDLISFSNDPSTHWSKKELAEVIEARVREIFEELAKELKRLGRLGLLPGGCVLYGGGAKLGSILDVAKTELRLPGRLVEFRSNEGEEAMDLEFINACALAYWNEKHSSGERFSFTKDKSGPFMRFLKSLLP